MSNRLFRKHQPSCLYCKGGSQGPTALTISVTRHHYQNLAFSMENIFEGHFNSWCTLGDFLSSKYTKLYSFWLAQQSSCIYYYTLTSLQAITTSSDSDHVLVNDIMATRRHRLPHNSPNAQRKAQPILKHWGTGPSLFIAGFLTEI